jgi:hypothetical protein
MSCMQDLARNYRNNPVMLQELNILTNETTAVAESTVDYMSEVAKDSKQDTSIVNNKTRFVGACRIRIIQ